MKETKEANLAGKKQKDFFDPRDAGQLGVSGVLHVRLAAQPDLFFSERYHELEFCYRQMMTR